MIPISAYLALALILFCIGLIWGFNKTQHSDCLNLYGTYAECGEHQPCRI